MVIVDASVWVSRLVPQDAFHAVSRDWLERYTLAGGEIVAPALLLSEVSGAVARRIDDARFALQAVEVILRLPVLRVVAVDERLARDAAALAANLRLRGADAIYVAVARRLDIPLVTLDIEQRDRAREVVVVRAPQDME